ncbi:hypothetical protein ACF073_23225 [Streptomyces sp. NPDC015171]|uniref:hypothetical protein n=1 Tax=Streptomyces sp. NPDC015171 TaxID=3364945 RepID=UPI0037009AA5
MADQLGRGESAGRGGIVLLSVLGARLMDAGQAGGAVLVGRAAQLLEAPDVEFIALGAEFVLLVPKAGAPGHQVQRSRNPLADRLVRAYGLGPVTGPVVLAGPLEDGWPRPLTGAETDSLMRRFSGQKAEVDAALSEGVKDLLGSEALLRALRNIPSEEARRTEVSQARPGTRGALPDETVLPERVVRAAANRRLGALVDVPQGPLSPYGAAADPAWPVVLAGSGIGLSGLLILLVVVFVPTRGASLGGLLIAALFLAGGLALLVAGVRKSGGSVYRYEGGFVRARPAGVRAIAWSDISAVQDVLTDTNHPGRSGSSVFHSYSYKAEFTLRSGGKVELHYFGGTDRRVMEAKAHGLVQLAQQAKRTLGR